MKCDNSLRRRPALVLILALGLSVSCGDDDGPTGNGGSVGGPLGDFAALLDQTVEKYLENNQPAFVSLQTFAPSIPGVLSVAPGVAIPVTSASLQQQGCIDPAIHGTTYEYDFGQNAYVAGQMTGAPTDGARFLLYEGQQANGHLDVTCPGDLPTINVTMAIVWDGLTVYSATTTGNVNLTNLSWSVNTTGFLRDPLSTDVLNIEPGGLGVGTQVTSSGFQFVIPAEDFTVSLGLNEQNGAFVSGLAIKGSGVDHEWSLMLTADGTSAESLSGYVDLASVEVGQGVVACVSGSFEAPTFSDASGCTDEAQLPVYGGVTSAHRSALAAGYAALYTIWETLTEIMQTGIEVAISSAG